jgi:hypothetical protein
MEVVDNTLDFTQAAGRHAVERRLERLCFRIEQVREQVSAQLCSLVRVQVYPLLNGVSLSARLFESSEYLIMTVSWGQSRVQYPIIGFIVVG